MFALSPPPHPPNPQTTGFHHVLQPKHCNTILPLLNRVGQGFRKVAVSLLDMIKWSLTWILSTLVGLIDLTTTFGSKNSDVLIKKKIKNQLIPLQSTREKQKEKKLWLLFCGTWSLIMVPVCSVMLPKQSKIQAKIGKPSLNLALQHF